MPAQAKPDNPVKKLSLFLLLLLHIGLDFCNLGMNAVFGCYKTQRYTAKYPAVPHSGFGSVAILAAFLFKVAKEASSHCIPAISLTTHTACKPMYFE